MSYTETTTTSLFERIKGAFVKFFVGFILVFGCIGLLFWNEGRAIQTYRALVEGAGLVVSVDSASADSANNGKLIHISGAVTPEGVPSDSQFGISAANAVAISRQVKMYQWVEKSQSKTEKQLGGSEETVTTYSYAKDWRSDVVDSSNFKQPDGHDNPGQMLESDTFPVESAKVGGFIIMGKDIANLGTESALPLSADDTQRLSDGLGGSQPVSRDAGGAYVGANKSSPQVGDMRIVYKRLDLKNASFVGAQKDDTIVPFRTSNRREIFLGQSGNVEAPQMFESAQSENTIITWLVRLGGLAGIFIGFACIFSLLGVIGDIVPFIGSIVSFGTSVMAFALTMIVGPIVIAIGWIAYRPLLALSVIVAGVAIAAAVFYLRRKRQAGAVGHPA